MRVLHVLDELRASGGEVMLRDAIEPLRAHGVEVIVLSTGQRVGDFASEYQRLGVEILHLPFERHARFAARFHRLARTAGVDVIHIHTERANAVLGFAARLAGRRTIRTVHNVFAYAGRLRTIRTVERAMLRTIGVRHVSIGASVEHNERLRLRNTTDRVDNWIGAQFRPPDDDERDASRRHYDLAADVIAITTIGNCSRVKNHVAVLKALPHVARALERRVVYLHAGSGADEDDERALARSIQTGDVEARFLGTVSDVRPLLWASDVYCMPSLYEGLGIAALEALACGVPSVLADVDGLRDVHPPSVSVRFVEPVAADVAAGVTQLLADASAARSPAREAAETVRRSRSVERRVAQLVTLYGSRRP